jgi:transcription antitermination factor NusG
MKIWTSARVKSNKQGDIIARYNLEFHNRLENAICRFFTPSGMLGDDNVSVMPNLLFVQMDVPDVDKLSRLFSTWTQLDSNMYYTNVIKDEETDSVRVETTTDKEMEEFMAGVTVYFSGRDSLDMKVGDEVEIISGYFRGKRGVIRELKREKVVVLLSVMKTAVPVEVLKSAIQVA